MGGGSGNDDRREGGGVVRIISKKWCPNICMASYSIFYYFNYRICIMISSIVKARKGVEVGYTIYVSPIINPRITTGGVVATQLFFNLNTTSCHIFIYPQNFMTFTFYLFSQRSNCRIDVNYLTFYCRASLLRGGQKLGAYNPPRGRFCKWFFWNFKLYKFKLANRIYAQTTHHWFIDTSC